MTQAPIAEADEQEDEEESSANTELRRSRASTEFSGVGDIRMDIKDAKEEEAVGAAGTVADDIYVHTAHPIQGHDMMPTNNDEDKEMLDFSMAADYISLGNYDEHDTIHYTPGDGINHEVNESLMPDWTEQLQHAASERNGIVPESRPDVAIRDAIGAGADAGTQWAQQLEGDGKAAMEVEDQNSKGEEFNGFPDSPELTPQLPPRGK